MPQGAGALKDEETPLDHQHNQAAVVKSEEDDHADADAINSEDLSIDELKVKLGKMEARYKRM